MLNLSDAKLHWLAPFNKLVIDRGVQLAALACMIWAVTPIVQKRSMFETVLAVSKTSILFSALLGALFFRETRMRERFSGAVVMVVGVVLLAL